MSQANPVPELSFDELYRRLDAAEQALVSAASPERRRQLLSERGRALAEARRDAAGEEGREVLAFRVGGERYAVPIEEVDEVVDVKGLHGLAGAPRGVLGGLMARARVVPVLDLRQLLGLEGGGMSDMTQILVVGRGDDLFGVAVEAVEGNLQLPGGAWSPPAAGPFLHLAPDRLAVLDLARLGSEGGGRK